MTGADRLDSTRNGAAVAPWREKWPVKAFFVVSVALLFLGFFRNQWGAARDGKFRNFQRDSEILVIGRLVESRQHGIFSSAGFLGAGDVEQHTVKEEERFFDYQYEVYLSGGAFDTVSTYRSQSGGQGWLFSALDALSPSTPWVNLRLFHVLTSLALAVALALLVQWALLEFGWISAAVMLISALASPWLTVYGRNLFYVAGFYYLPMAAATVYLARNSERQGRLRLGLAGVLFGTVAAKCLLNGYDYILPSAGMPAIPIVFYAVRDRWQRSEFIRQAALAATAALVAIVLTLALLAAQNAILSGSFTDGVRLIMGRLAQRTGATSDSAAGGSAGIPVNTLEILRTYVVSDLAVGQTSLRFLDLIALYGAATAVYFLRERLLPIGPQTTRNGRALIAATWLSILSPILWYTIFKGQAYFHTHTNFLAWYMPFTLLGFALCGFVVQVLLFRAPRDAART